MFGFLTKNDSDKEIALPFKVVLEGREDGYFLAKVPSLPGCTARGRSKSEALKNIQEAVRLHLDAAQAAAFDVVWEDPTHPVLNCAHSFYGRWWRAVRATAAWPARPATSAPGRRAW